MASFLDSDAEELKRRAEAEKEKVGTGTTTATAGLNRFKGLSKYSSLTAKYRKNPAAVETDDKGSALPVEQSRGTISPETETPYKNHTSKNHTNAKQIPYNEPMKAADSTESHRVVETPYKHHTSIIGNTNTIQTPSKHHTDVDHSKNHTNTTQNDFYSVDIGGCEVANSDMLNEIPYKHHTDQYHTNTTQTHSAGPEADHHTNTKQAVSERGRSIHNIDPKALNTIQIPYISVEPSSVSMARKRNGLTLDSSAVGEENNHSSSPANQSNPKSTQEKIDALVNAVPPEVVSLEESTSVHYRVPTDTLPRTNHGPVPGTTNRYAAGDNSSLLDTQKQHLESPSLPPISNTIQIPYEHQINTTQTPNSDHTNAIRTPNQHQTNSAPTPNQHHTKHHTDNASEFSISMLTGQQKRLIEFIFQSCKENASLLSREITSRDVGALLNLKVDDLNDLGKHVATVVGRLIKKGFLARAKSKLGRGGWTIYELPKEVYQQLLAAEQTPYKYHTFHQQNPPSKLVSNLNNTNSLTSQEDPFKDVDISILSRHGITRKQIQDCRNQKLQLTAEQLQYFIDRFAVYMENPSSNTIRSPAGLFMSWAQKLANGVDILKGVKTSDDILAEKLEDELAKNIEEREARKQRLLELRFQDWVGGLTEDQKAAAAPNYKMTGNKDAKIALLKNAFFQMQDELSEP